MSIRRILFVAAALAACESPNSPSRHSPPAGLSEEGIRRLENPSPTSITVYGHTSRDGEFWNIPATNCQTTTLHHTHRDSTGAYVPVTHTIPAYCASGGWPTPYNGGWINVYARHDEGEEYLTQVAANMKYVTVSTTTLTRSFRLVAVPAGTQQLSNGTTYNCAFDLWLGQPYGQSTITVGNSGAHEAFFSCVAVP